MLNSQVFTPNEAADYLKINPQILEKYLRQGLLPARKLGRQWRLSKLALDLWLAPELANVLPRLTVWNQIFSLGDQIAAKTSLTDADILESVADIRKSFKRRQ